MNKVLAIDDEDYILELIQYNLEQNGFEVVTCNDGSIAMNTALNIKPDIILLDLMLPKINGFDICKKLRENPVTRKTPIIILTARDSETDKVMGLELGADDFITKPFSIRELIARIRSAIRRKEEYSNSEELQTNKIKIIDLVIDTETHEVFKSGKPVELTTREYDILLLLAQNRSKVITRQEILNRFWGEVSSNASRALDVHIRNLRQKIYDNSIDYIETVRGIGVQDKVGAFVL